MSVNFLLILAILALLSWGANHFMALASGIREVQARVRSARDQIERYEHAIERLRHEADSLEKDILKEGEALVELRQSHQEAQQQLSVAAAKRRRRLLIISDRRTSSDHEWLVVITNPRFAEIDASNPLAEEWTKGREYLVWAENEKEAAERTLRRFSARPGYSVKSVDPVHEDFYPAVVPPAA